MKSENIFTVFSAEFTQIVKQARDFYSCRIDVTADTSNTHGSGSDERETQTRDETMKLTQLPTVATFETARGALVLKVGSGSSGIFRQWVGKKTRSAKRETINLSVECSGPTEWVLKMWNDRYSK